MCKHCFVIVLLAYFLVSCQESIKERSTRLIKEWEGKVIRFPVRSVFTVIGRDTVDFDFMDAKYKVVTYIDSTGCVSCKLQLNRWKQLIAKIDSVTHGNVPFLFYLHPKDIKELRYLTRRDNFIYPVCFDEKDEFNALNQFPDEMMFQTFLLDKDNRVLALGNPVLNPQIEKLYLKELTGKDKSTDTSVTEMTIDPTEYDFGTFSMSERQECIFRITNTGSSLLMVQDVVTSCGCTKVEYDKRPVPPGQTIDLKVIYEAEESGRFTKVMIVYSNAETSPVRLRIKGNAK